MSICIKLSLHYFLTRSSFKKTHGTNNKSKRCFFVIRNIFENNELFVEDVVEDCFIVFSKISCLAANNYLVKKNPYIFTLKSECFQISLNKANKWINGLI